MPGVVKIPDPPVQETARTILELIKGSPAGTSTSAIIPGLTVNQLGALCSVVVRLEAYLSWAEGGFAGRDEGEESSYQAGYVEAHRDVACMALGGNLEDMLRDIGETELVKSLRELGMSS